MWVQQNNNSMFNYQKIKAKVDGGLIAQSMPYTLSIQTPWQREMMIKHGQLMQPLGQMRKNDTYNLVPNRYVI
jgi:hypothetical protein